MKLLLKFTTLFTAPAILFFGHASTAWAIEVHPNIREYAQNVWDIDSDSKSGTVPDYVLNAAVAVCEHLCPNGSPQVPGDTDMNDLISKCLGDDQRDCPQKFKVDKDTPIQCWDTSQVKSMKKAFYGMADFNEELQCYWSTKSVTNMDSMFAMAKNFNKPVRYWDVTKVTDMSLMFFAAEKFNQPLDGKGWVHHRGLSEEPRKQSYMFLGSNSFEKENVSTWHKSPSAEILSYDVKTLKGAECIYRNIQLDYFVGPPSDDYQWDKNAVQCPVFLYQDPEALAELEPSPYFIYELVECGYC